MRFSHSASAGAHELRIVRRVADGLRVGVIGGLAHLERGVVIAERAPRIRQRGLEMHRAPQRLDGLFALPEPPERETRERQRIRLVGNDLQDFVGLLAAAARASRCQQPRRMRERDLERAGGFGGVRGMDY